MSQIYTNKEYQMLSINEIKKIITSGFLLILLKWQKFMAVSLLPLLAISLGIYFIDMPLVKLLENATQTQLIWILVILYASITWSINIHRMILLGDDSVGQFGEYIPNRRVGLYLGTLILLMVMIIVVVLIAQLVITVSISVIMFIAYMFMFYLVIKMSLKFPAISIDDKDFMKQNLEKNNIAPLFFILILLPIMVSMLIGSLIGLLGDNIFAFIVAIFMNILMFYWGVVNLALSYQTLKDKR
jgi:hypothetical protein